MPRKLQAVPVPQVTHDDPLLPHIEAAQYIGLTMHTLDQWRYEMTHGIRPFTLPFLKVGGKVLYRKSVLDAYLESCKVEA